MACCRPRNNLLHPPPRYPHIQRSRRGWSRWRSPAETLSINGPTRPPPFFFPSLSLFSICFYKPPQRWTEEKRKAIKIIKKSFTSQTRSGGGGMQGEILKVYFLKRKREIEERMYLIEMLSSISFSFFFLFFSCQFLRSYFRSAWARTHKRKNRTSTVYDRNAIKAKNRRQERLNRQLVLELTRNISVDESIGQSNAENMRKISVNVFIRNRETRAHSKERHDKKYIKNKGRNIDDSVALCAHGVRADERNEMFSLCVAPAAIAIQQRRKKERKRELTGCE